MSILERVVGRLRSWIAGRFQGWSETGVADSACCTPEHLLPKEDAVSRRRTRAGGEDHDPGR